MHLRGIVCCCGFCTVAAFGFALSLVLILNACGVYGVIGLGAYVAFEAARFLSQSDGKRATQGTGNNLVNSNDNPRHRVGLDYRHILKKN